VTQRKSLERGILEFVRIGGDGGVYILCPCRLEINVGTHGDCGNKHVYKQEEYRTDDNVLEISFDVHEVQ